MYVVGQVVSYDEGAVERLLKKVYFADYGEEILSKFS